MVHKFFMALALLLAASPLAPALAASLLWHGSTTIAEGRGERGPWQQNNSRYDYVDDPTVALNDQGDIVFARSEDGGATFSPPMNLSNSVGGDGKGRIIREIWHNGSLDLIAGPGGALYAAWTEYEGALWFARSLDGGYRFSLPQRLAGGGKAKPVRAPALALGPGPTLYLAWTTGDDSAADIHLMQSGDGGDSFSAPIPVAPSKTYSDAPKLAVDDAGTLHLVYAESLAGPIAPYRVRYTRSTNGGRSFDAPRDISAAQTGAAFPSLAVDAQSRLVVLWEQYPDHRQGPMGLGLVVSDDGGRSFGPPVLVPGSRDPAGGTNGSHQGLLMKKLAVNAAGALAIVNSSLKQDDKSRVWLMRGQLAP